MEALTRELEGRALELIAQVDERGGAVAAIEAGWIQGEIEAAAFRHQQEVESGERVIVGVNRYTESGDQEVELQRIDPAAERRQLERTARVRAGRDAAEAARALDAVRAAARDATVNLLAADARGARVSCTVGEICDTLREEFGTQDGRAAR